MQDSSASSPLLRLAAEAWHHVGYLAGGTACLVCTSLAELKLMQTGGVVLDLLPEGAAGRWDALDHEIYKLAGCLLCMGVVKHVGEFLIKVAGERLVARTRKALFLSLLRQPVPAFDDSPTGELVSVLFAEVEAIHLAIAHELPKLIRDVAGCLLSVVGMAQVSLRLPASRSFGPTSRRNPRPNPRPLALSPLALSP